MADGVVAPPVEKEEQGMSSDATAVELEGCPDNRRERRLLWKIDIHLVLPLWIVFTLGFMDRINLGIVGVLGILPDLHLNGNAFNIALQVFYVPYILVEIPSNIFLKKVTPSTWIALLTFLWGVACMCQGFVKSNSGLIACRFFLGLFEGGFVPGCAYLMSMYYKRHEFQKRFSLFWCAGLIAGAFSGLLAYALVHMGGERDYAGWRWIFIIEGLLSVAVSVPAKFLLADWPEEASFLTAGEKQLLLDRNRSDVRGSARMDHLDAAAWKLIFTDWKLYIASLIYLGITVSGQATALFVPTIVNSLGYSGIQSQVHSIPVWVVAAIVTLATAIISDRTRHRYGFMMFGIVFAGIGYVILLCQGPLSDPLTHRTTGLPLKVRYMAVFFVATGCYMVQPNSIVWVANNLGGHYKRSIGLALMISFGNIGGIIASNTFVQTQAPRYFIGYGTSLAMLLFCGIMCTAFALGLVMENKKRERGDRNYRLALPESVLGNTGDDDPRFRFTL
ncbi:major facilitator superfamily domain-containing protein [Usnea florida]